MIMKARLWLWRLYLDIYRVYGEVGRSEALVVLASTPEGGLSPTGGVSPFGGTMQTHKHEHEHKHQAVAASGLASRR